MEALQCVEDYIDITRLSDQERVYLCYDAERNEIARGTEAEIADQGFRLAGRSDQEVRAAA